MHTRIKPYETIRNAHTGTVCMIGNYAFGRMIINGREYRQDLKIINGRIVQNWRRKNGHRLDDDDIQDILSERPDFLVIGTGYSGQMRIAKSLCDRLDDLRINVTVQNTGTAVRTFNKMVHEGKIVSGAFHLTC